MRSPELHGPSKHSDVGATRPEGEYAIPSAPDYAPDTQVDPTRKKSRRGLFTAVGAAAGLAASIGVFMSTQGGASERPAETKPSASAPANPGETAPANEGKEKLTAAEMIATFESQIDANLDKELLEQPGVNFDQDSADVSLDVLDALSDWTMTGVTKENLAAYTTMKDASVKAELSVDDFNSVPSLADASELIADKVSEKQLAKLDAEIVDEDTLQHIRDVNANNILAGLTALNDKTGEVEPFESEFVPEAMTTPVNYNGTYAFIRFNEESTPNQYKKDVLVREASGQAINYLRVDIAEGGQSLKRITLTEMQPSQPMEPVEVEN